MLGIVVIGRNEGDKLAQCLDSARLYTDKIVYVDSASTDNSVEMAKGKNVNTVNLDLSVPFTAARARNAGYDALVEVFPEVEYVQFVDGDCEILDGWIDFAIQYISTHTQVAIVCGRRLERYPNASIYNKLCDIEWNTPAGETKSCGGDFLIKKNVFMEVNGFNESLIAGEEPELCVRIRKKRWKIIRLDKMMTLHDANITKLSQWWKRNIRAGYAYSLGVAVHGKKPERHNVRQLRSVVFWGGILPLLIIFLGILDKLFIGLFLLYPVQIIRIAIKKKRKIENNWLYALFIIIGKIPEVQGVIKYYLDRIFRVSSTLIEYK